MKPTIIVAGAARCGSSLTMQMLHAAGVPTIGDYPDFECPIPGKEGLIVEEPEQWAAAVGRKASKLLDPHLSRLHPLPDVRIIFLTRNPIEQARSQIKFLRLMGGLTSVRDDRGTRRSIGRSIVEDMPKMRASLKAVGDCDFLEQNFEQLVSTPITCALRLCRYIGITDEVVAMKMAERVIPRSPECQPTMLEARLI